MNIAQTAVKRPVFTAMVFAGLFLLGAIAWHLLPRDMLPGIEIPALTVVTLYPGASAWDVENEVTQPLEEVLAGVNNLKTIQSQSKENVSFITLQFDWNTNLDVASGSVRDFLEFSRRNLPADASSPMVMRISSDMFPVLIYGVSSTGNGDNLGAVVDDQIANTLKRSPGVGALVVMGKPEKEVEVALDPLKMKAFNLSIAMVAQAIQSGSLSIPSGSVVFGSDEFSVTVPSGFSSVEELASIIIAQWQGQMLRLGDVAEIKVHARAANETVRVEGEPAVGIFVQKQAGANILEVVESVRYQMDQLRPQLPEGVQVVELMDNSEMVTATLKNLFSTIMYAAFFVIVVVILFLRRLRSSIIIILTIPFSLIVAFIFMHMMGYTINIFSLMSLAVAIGMVIDNAIVILENITRHIEKGVAPIQAAVFGTREMAGAVFAATLTTICVFVPLLFLEGVVGIMFRQLAVITAVTMLASLFTAVFLTPMLASVLLKETNPDGQKYRLFGWSEQAFIRLEQIYFGMLKKCLAHRFWVIGASLLLLGGTVFIGARLGTDYIPEFDAGDLSIVAETRLGASTESTLELAREIENIVQEEIPEIRNLYSLTGQSDQGLLSSVGFREGKNVTTVFARTILPEYRDRTSLEMAEAIREKVGKLPEVESMTVSGGSLISSAVLGNIKPLGIRISGRDIDAMNDFAAMITEKLSGVQGIHNIESTVDRGRPEMQFHVDNERAAFFGVNNAMVAMQLRQGIYGQQAGVFQLKNDQIPVNIRFHERYTSDPALMERLTLVNVLGEVLMAGQVAEVMYAAGPLEIQRENQQRVVFVYAEPSGVSLGEAASRVEEALKDIVVPEGISMELAGQVVEQEKAFGNLRIMFLLGFLLVFMVMASQFESLKHPFVIIFTIPFSLTGAVLAFGVMGLTLNVVTFLGMIMLLGIVVNNGIVLVDYANLLINRGYSVYDAIVESGRSRLRPVLMTTFTTLFGMLPMTMSRGIGSEIWSPLAMTIIGGLLVSTLVTLILVPVMYLWLSGNGAWKNSNKQKISGPV